MANVHGFGRGGGGDDEDPENPRGPMPNPWTGGSAGPAPAAGHTLVCGEMINIGSLKARAYCCGWVGRGAQARLTAAARPILFAVLLSVPGGSAVLAQPPHQLRQHHEDGARREGVVGPQLMALTLFASAVVLHLLGVRGHVRRVAGRGRWLRSLRAEPHARAGQLHARSSGRW